MTVHIRTHDEEKPHRPEPPRSRYRREYFVPKDGIDKVVITADICRYLGNDALVRPAYYEVSFYLKVTFINIANRRCRTPRPDNSSKAISLPRTKILQL